MYKLIIITLLLALSGAHAFWSSCGGSATTHSITSAACSGDRCQATRGQPLTSDTVISFTGSHNVLNVRVTAFILGVGVNLPVDAPANNACNNLQLGGSHHGCPTTPNVQYNWLFELIIPGTLPAFTNTRTRFELLENNVVLSCVELIADLN